MAVVDDDRDIFYLSKLKFNCHPEEYQVLPLFWLGKVQVKLCVNKKACHPSTPARKQGQRTITVFYSSTAQL
jgi:hypothetical protein